MPALSSCPEPENNFNRVAGQSVESASSSAGQAFRPDQNRPGRDRAWSGLTWPALAWACAPSSSSSGSSVPPARFATRLDIAAQKLPQTNQQTDSPSVPAVCLCVRACRSWGILYAATASFIFPLPPLSCSTLPLAPHSASLHIYNFIYETGLFLLAGRMVAAGLICCTPSAPPLLLLLLFPLPPSPVCLLATHAAKRNENATALHASGSVAVAVAVALATSCGRESEREKGGTWGWQQYVGI